MQEQRKISFRQFQVRLVLAILFILFVWISIEYINLLYKQYQIELKKQWFVEENDRLIAQNQQLEKEYEYFKTDYFFKKEAKRKLNKKEPGEKVIILSEKLKSSAKAKPFEYQVSPLRRWWDYLFSPSSNTDQSFQHSGLGVRGETRTLDLGVMNPTL